MRAIESGSSGERQAAVPLQQPGGGEGRQRLPPPPLQQAEGEGGVHLAHAELQPAAGGVEVEAAAAAHLDAVGQLLLGGGEEALDLEEVPLPDHRVELADDLVAVPLLDQLEVDVPAAARPHALRLPHHPDGGEGLAEELAHLPAELGDAVGGLEERQNGQTGLPEPVNGTTSVPSTELSGIDSAHSIAFFSPAVSLVRNSTASSRSRNRRQMKVCPAGAVK